MNLHMSSQSEWCSTGAVAAILWALAGPALAEVLTVPSDDPAGVVSSPLQSGVLYDIHAEGFFTHASEGQQADAEWHHVDPDGAWEESPTGLDHHLLIDGTEYEWWGLAHGSYGQHRYSPTHEYQVCYLGEGTSLQFSIQDSQYGDNSGSLTVTISVAEDCNNNGVCDFLDIIEGRGFNDVESWATYDPGADGVGTDPDGYAGTVFDGRYVYFIPLHNGGQYHAEVLRYDITGAFGDPFSWTTFDTGAAPVNARGGYVGGVFDGRYIYFVPWYSGGHSAEVLRCDTWLDFADPGSWDTYDAHINSPFALGGYHGGVFDGRHVYFVPLTSSGGSHGEVLRYDTNGDFSSPDAWSKYDPGDNGVGSDAYAYAVLGGRHVYFVPACTHDICHGEVLRYDKFGDFDDVASWTAYDPGDHDVGSDPDGFRGAAFDGRYVYFAPDEGEWSQQSGEVMRYDTFGDFANVTSWDTLDYGEQCGGECSDPDGFHDVLFDGSRYVYFVPYFNGDVFHAEVLRYDTAEAFDDAFSWDAFDVQTSSLAANGGYEGAATDGQYIYFAPQTKNAPDAGAHGEVLRYDMTNGWSPDCNGNDIPDECDIADCDGSAWCDDCDDDGVPDGCEPDFDGDGIMDDCDPDIDEDGVLNEDDACDYTPFGAPIITAPGHPLRGTLRGDLDGDCDCDLADFAILQVDFTGPNG